MAKQKAKAKRKRTKKKDPEKDSWSYKAWYDSNKKELAARRKERYATDPEDKERVLEQNRKHRDPSAKRRPSGPNRRSVYLGGAGQ